MEQLFGGHVVYEERKSGHPTDNRDKRSARCLPVFTRR